ncbi:DeoR/GlpR transcriptional regulator [Fulvivirga sp. M361]|uniref:DeoR/GlpR family DNA-binding transcription regulator n=1 Tax=Fulvivirga sp. M361 TaxID=2594266 RepID=UPI00117A0C31|nr:DeoR/GlpR family DNA-binding transcription regulator [Fulvivirga sp. M361]TRX53374.1 DeoR/GlpR transcriptional regulator [Fulvivirga sp. M361]
MLKVERQNAILQEIRTHNKVHSSKLSQLLNVSEDTIRRDLRELAGNGHIKKVHGGAMANPNSPESFRKQKISQQAEREIIAEKAASLFQSGQVILMEGESTNLLLVDYIPDDMTLTIFTNSLRLATKLFNYQNIETVLLGGKISHKYPMTLGIDVINALGEIHADLFFTEIDSIHEDIGITDGDRENAYTKKAMFRSSSQVIAMCLSNEIGTIQPFKVESVSQIHMIITEESPDHHQLNRFSNKGVQIL